MAGRGGGRGFGGGGRGGGRGGGGGRGFGGGRGAAPMGPPDVLLEMGVFSHACEGEMVYKSTNEKIPKFNWNVYLENKQTVGKVDEIFGPINEVYFTVKPAEGFIATSFKPGDKVYIGNDGLLPPKMFSEAEAKKAPPTTPGPGGRGRAGGRGRGGGRGGRGFGGGRGGGGGRGFGGGGRGGGGRGFGGGGRGGGGRGFGGGRGRQ